MMRISDVERFVGIAYDEATMDCADFVVLVQRELFGREVILPNGRPRGARGSAVLGELSKPYGARTEIPQDGDLVLMLEGGRIGHAGVFFRLAHEDWVLHSSHRIGQSILHRARELPDWGATVEGYYAWA